jgi:hypothetical protein
MTAAVIQDLVAELLIFVVGATGYHGTPAAPTVLPVARPVLEQRVCGKPCPVFALFDPDQGILVDDRLDLSGNPAAQSVLLHELVHYLQWRATGRTARTCDEWLAREREAYRIQFRWLATLPAEWGNVALPRPNLSHVRCRTGPLETSATSPPNRGQGVPVEGPAPSNDTVIDARP